MYCQRQAVVHHSEHAARLEYRVHRLEQFAHLLVAVADPVVHVAEGEHHVNAACRRDVVLFARLEQPD